MKKYVNGISTHALLSLVYLGSCLSMNDALSDKTDSLYEFGLSGFRFQRQAGHFAVQTHIV